MGLIDSNSENIEKAKLLGLESIEGNVYNDELLEDIELSDVGYLMALTGSSSVNDYVIEKFSSYLGEQGAFKLISTDEMKEGKTSPNEQLFTHKDDFINLSETVRDFPLTNEVLVESEEHYNKLLKEINQEPYAIPLFLKDKSGFIHIISSLKEKIKIENGFTLVYVGKTVI